MGRPGPVIENLLIAVKPRPQRVIWPPKRKDSTGSEPIGQKPSYFCACFWTRAQSPSNLERQRERDKERENGRGSSAGLPREEWRDNRLWSVRCRTRNWSPRHRQHHQKPSRFQARRCSGSLSLSLMHTYMFIHRTQKNRNPTLIIRVRERNWIAGISEISCNGILSDCRIISNNRGRERNL